MTTSEHDIHCVALTPQLKKLELKVHLAEDRLRDATFALRTAVDPSTEELKKAEAHPDLDGMVHSRPLGYTARTIALLVLVMLDRKKTLLRKEAQEGLDELHRYSGEAVPILRE